MSDKPILFSAPMVKALLAGTKTQTRRTMSTKPNAKRPNLFDGTWSDDYVLDPGNEAWRQAALRIHVGDRLYVREAWRPGYNAEGWREDLGRVAKPSDFDPKTTPIEYLADGTRDLGGDNRPGIHMPRWASRLTLHVTDARVQRLQDISEEDAKAEGVEPVREFTEASYDRGSQFYYAKAYASLWDRINGAGSWDANPWVAAYTFDVEHCNIAEARKP